MASVDGREAAWRSKFEHLTEDLCRESGQPLPDLIDCPDTHLVFGLEVDGAQFDLLHFPDANERLVVHAHIDSDGAAIDAERMHAALVVNQELARAHAGMYALGGEGRLEFVTADSLRSATAPTLIAGLRQWLSETRA